MKITDFNVTDYLKTDKDINEYLEAALLDGSPEVIQAAIGDIAKAKGMSAIARKTGLNRESLYKSLSIDGNPAFSTVAKVINALGGTLKIDWQTTRNSSRQTI